MCGERVDFCFSPPIPSSAPITSTPPTQPMPTGRPDVVSKIKVFDRDGGLRMWPTVLHDVPPPIPLALGSLLSILGR